MPVIALEPVIGAATPSLTLVAMLKFELKFADGVNTTPASSVLTFAIAPDALQTPVAALYVDVTAPEVPVDKPPAAAFERVSVAVTDELSISDTTMSIRFSGVSSV